MDNEMRYAVLIDADNVAAKYTKNILDELSNYGIATYKRVYGDWTRTSLAGWKNMALDNAITPVQQYSYTTGKNATDSAMIIDAMDILYSNNVDGFCIVSSDSDFTRLAIRLRESGKHVIGMGEKKTPKPFSTACNAFKYLEILAEEEVQNNEVDRVEMKTLEEAIIRIIAENANLEEEINIGELGSRLQGRYPDFDVIFVITLVGCCGMLATGSLFTPIAVNIIFKMYRMTLALIETDTSDNMPIIRSLFMAVIVLIGTIGLVYFRFYLKKNKIRLSHYKSELSFRNRFIHSVKIFPFSAVLLICIIYAATEVML